MPAVLGVLCVALPLLASCARMRRLPAPAPIRIVDEVPEARAMGHFLKAKVALDAGDYDTAIKEYENVIAADPKATLPRLRLANLYVRAGDLEAANKQCAAVVAASPQNVEARLLWAGVLTALERDDEALVQYDDVLKLEPDNQEAYLYLGALHAKHNRTEEALATFEKLIEINPSSVLAYYYVGRVQAMRKAYPEAEKAFREALRLSPRSEQIVTALAFVYQLQGEKDKAIAVYKDFLRGSPKSVTIRRRLGGLLVGERKFDEALEQLQEIEGLETDPSETRIKIGLVSFEKGDHDGAITSFNLVLASNPDDDRVRYYLAVAYAAAKQPAEAIREFSQIPSGSRYYVDARIQLGTLYQQVDAVDAGIASINEALEHQPDNTELLGVLASLHRDKKDLPEAIAILNRMVALDPENDRMFFTLGALYDEAGDQENTVRAMRRAIEINDHNAAALNYLGYTFVDDGERLDEAEQLIRRALELEPNEGFYVDSLGWLYYQRGEYVVAIEHLENAVELSGDDPTISEHLGDAYDKADRAQDALRLYRRALGFAQEPEQVERLQKKITALERAAKTQRGQ
jgi:tetratricopeptide (TPR) repeat protein